MRNLTAIMPPSLLSTVKHDDENKDVSNAILQPLEPRRGMFDRLDLRMRLTAGCGLHRFGGSQLRRPRHGDQNHGRG